MTRNTPEILPYCKHCGSFKGVGSCKNPKCDETNRVEIGAIGNQSNKCVICSSEGEHSCSRCGVSYCNKHAIGKEESKLISIEQYLGTCVVCGKIICERCWIFNNKGVVTCLIHVESRNDL
ncbi:MAG: hypothetical protein KAJ36_01180 [Candidatus Thorarchaeota archaeon]|nr:hypothetical protein [Candidatus Thorarchaeota archaeon]MCK5389069.1 hypothetical protein [Candidatus Thorarchaeota archaeon]